MTKPDLQPIVVGIDGSDNSLAALRWALREGVATGATVEVVHCRTAQTFTEVVFITALELHTASVCMLESEVRSAVATMTEKPVTTEISLPGNPASVLVDRSANARLLVLGVRQAGNLRDLAYGAVGTVCRRNASCPVVSVDRDGTVAWHHPNHQLAGR